VINLAALVAAFLAGALVVLVTFIIADHSPDEGS
jgi:hypothetical protein